ncbi:MAG: PEP-CTERM sorting domain-containing protein [Planctomycetaceae bacterium]
MAGNLQADQVTSPYTDAIGDIDPGITTANGTLDIVKMEVSNTPTDITFKLTLNGDVTNPDWAKYLLGIATLKTDGTVTGNGWGRPINLSYDNDPFAAQLKGMNHWVGAWVDGSSQKPIGGSELYTFNDATQVWVANGKSWDAGNPYPWPYTVTIGAQSTVEWSFPLALFGLNVGDTFYFDAYSSGGGGGDSAVDSLANPNVSITGWGGPYTSYTSSLGGPGINSYTVSAVPEPSSLAAVSVAGIAIAGHLMRRRRSA